MFYNRPNKGRDFSNMFAITYQNQGGYIIYDLFYFDSHGNSYLIYNAAFIEILFENYTYIFFFSFLGSNYSQITPFS